MLSMLRGKFVNFAEDYAEWLPSQLEYLTHSSIDILRNLNPDEFEHVRYSTIVSLNTKEEKNTFNKNMTVVTKAISREKRTILEKGILAS